MVTPLMIIFTFASSDSSMWLHPGAPMFVLLGPAAASLVPSESSTITWLLCSLVPLPDLTNSMIGATRFYFILFLHI